jgi:GWxTD domain-containing protein
MRPLGPLRPRPLLRLQQAAAAAALEMLALAILALAGLTCAACASAAGGGGSVAALAESGELANPLLGPEYTAWLIGPVARIASPAEIKAYLALHDDREAADFIQQFWERRNPRPGSRNPLLALFEERAEVADDKFTEAGVIGRRTDRGTILVLYGPPGKTGFEVAARPTEPAIEVWQYAANAPAGLDGKRPQAFYRFAKRGDLTVLYVPRPGTHLVPRTPRTAPP